MFTIVILGCALDLETGCNYDILASSCSLFADEFVMFFSWFLLEVFFSVFLLNWLVLPYLFKIFECPGYLGLFSTLLLFLNAEASVS